MKLARLLCLTTVLIVAHVAFCQVSSGAPAGNASSLITTHSVHTGTTVLRYVGGMKGPFRVLPVSLQGPAVLRIRADSGVLEVHLKDVNISLPAMLRSQLVRGLEGKSVFLEGSVNKDAATAYVYFLSRNGEWTAQHTRPLKQLNLSLIETGVATPAEKLNTRYAHFYQSALAQAQVEQLGLWATW